MSRPNWLIIDIEGLLDGNYNETLELTIPDSHHGPCNGSRWVESYCFNGGRCAYWKNLDKHFCICRYPYSGERCGVVDPGTQKGGPPVDLNTTTLGIAAILAVLLLVVIICGIAYIRYKNSVWRERKKEIEKAVKYLPKAYSAHASSRRESPIEGVLGFKQDLSSSDGLQQVVIIQEADGRISRAGSLGSNQYKLLTEVQMNGSNGDFRDQNSNRASRSSVV